MELFVLGVIILLFLILIIVCAAFVFTMPTILRQMGYSDKELNIWGR